MNQSKKNMKWLAEKKKSYNNNIKITNRNSARINQRKINWKKMQENQNTK